jgi:hypothetical protein
MRRGISFWSLLYIIIGVVVASTHGYLVGWNAIGNIIEGLLAILLWPVIALFGVDLHSLIL